MKNLEFSGLFQGRDVVLKQISKKSALAALIEGKRVLMCPAKMHPLGPWNMGMEMSAMDEDEFAEQVSLFRWHNCTSETGMYCRFYLVS